VADERFEPEGPVDWAFGKVLLETAFKPILCAVLPDRVDPRDWMRPRALKLADWRAHPTHEGDDVDDYWVDFVADTGDSDVAAASAFISKSKRGAWRSREPEIACFSRPPIRRASTGTTPHGSKSFVMPCRSRRSAGYGGQPDRFRHRRKARCLTRTAPAHFVDVARRPRAHRADCRRLHGPSRGVTRL
jgi:hypothetical protein